GKNQVTHVQDLSAEDCLCCERSSGCAAAPRAQGGVMTTDSNLRQINDEIFACQQTHCQLHHGGLLRVYPDCALCLALHRVAALTRTTVQQSHEEFFDAF